MFSTKKSPIFKPLHTWAPKGFYLGFTIKHRLYYTISELYKVSPDVTFHPVDYLEPWDSVGKGFFLLLEKFLSLSFY